MTMRLSPKIKQQHGAAVQQQGKQLCTQRFVVAREAHSGGEKKLIFYAFLLF